MDLITKWLVRGASAIIIFLGLAIIVGLPVVAFKLNYQLSMIQESAKEILNIAIQQIIS